MKSIYLTIAFVLGTFALNAQSEKLVKVMMNNAQLEYLDANVPVLNDVVGVVEKAYREADNYTIGKNKGEVIKIVTQASSLLNNICSMFQASEQDVNAAADRMGVDYETYAVRMKAEGGYDELELLPEEIEALAVLVTNMKTRKAKLKRSSYAIHESQKDEGAEANIDALRKLTADMQEAMKIIRVGQNR